MSAAVRSLLLTALATAVLSCCSFDFAKPSFGMTNVMTNVITNKTAVTGKKDAQTADKASDEQIIFLDKQYDDLLDLTFEKNDDIHKYKLILSESGVCISEITSDESGNYVIKLNDSLTAKPENIKDTAPSDLSLTDETAPFRIAEPDTGRAKLYGNKKEFSVYLTPEKNRYCLVMRIQMNDDATWRVSALTSNFTIGIPTSKSAETTPFYESPEFIAAEDSIRSLEERVSELEKQLAGLDLSDKLADESRRLTDYVDSNSASFRTIFIVILIFQVLFTVAIVLLAIFVFRSGLPVASADKNEKKPDDLQKPVKDHRGDISKNSSEPDFNIVMPTKNEGNDSFRKRLSVDINELERMSVDYRANLQPKPEPEPTVYVRISNYDDFRVYNNVQNSYVKLCKADYGELLLKDGKYVVLDGDYVDSYRITASRINYLFDFIRLDGSIIKMMSNEITRIIDGGDRKNTVRIVKPAIVQKDGDLYTLVEKGTLELRL